MVTFIYTQPCYLKLNERSFSSIRNIWTFKNVQMFDQQPFILVFSGRQFIAVSAVFVFLREKADQGDVSPQNIQRLRI
jgi:hypothetical protein